MSRITREGLTFHGAVLKVGIDVAKNLSLPGDHVVDTGLNGLSFQILDFLGNGARLHDYIDGGAAVSQTEPEGVAALLLPRVVLVGRRPEKQGHVEGARRLAIPRGRNLNIKVNVITKLFITLCFRSFNLE